MTTNPPKVYLIAIFYQLAIASVSQLEFRPT